MTDVPYVFTRELAQPLAQMARERLSQARSVEGSTRTNTPESRTQNYLIETDGGGIPAAIEALDLTPGSGMGWMLERDITDDSLGRVQYGGGDAPQVKVYNFTTDVITGTLLSPIIVVGDAVQGTLWIVGGGVAGEAYLVMGETKDTITAASITGGELTAGSGTVYLLFRDAGDGNKLKRSQDEALNDIEVVVWNTALQPIVKNDGRVLQLNRDIYGTVWSVPPDYGPTIIIENFSVSPIPKATYDDGTDTLTPAVGAGFLLAYNAGTGEVERRTDEAGNDITMVVRNPLPYLMFGSKGRPIYCDRDPDGNYWVRHAGAGIVFYKTYLTGPLPAMIGDTPGDKLLPTYVFDGNDLIATGFDELIYNPTEDPVDDTDDIFHAAVRQAGGQLFAVEGGAGFMPEDGCEELADKIPSDLTTVPEDDIDFALGVDGLCYVKYVPHDPPDTDDICTLMNGFPVRSNADDVTHVLAREGSVCVWVPVADCESLLQHA